MERTPVRLLAVCAAAAVSRAAASDVQSLFQKGLHTRPEIPPLVPKAEAPDAEVPTRPPKIDKEWLHQFTETWEPFVCHLQHGEHCEQRPAQHEDLDMASVMKFLQTVFTAVRSEEFMGNMTLLNDGIRSITGDLVTSSAVHVEDFVTAALPLNATEQVIPVLVRLFDEQINATSQYTTSITDLALKVLDSMPQKMADGVRPMITTMASQSAGIMNISFSPNCTVGEVCDLGDEFFFNLTEGLKTVTKMRRMTNSTQKMLPVISDHLTSMKPEVAPRVVYLIEQLTETSYIGTSDWIDIMQSFGTKVKPVLQDKLKCAFPKSAASTAGLCLGLLTAMLSFLVNGLLY